MELWFTLWLSTLPVLKANTISWTVCSCIEPLWTLADHNSKKLFFARLRWPDLITYPGVYCVCLYQQLNNELLKLERYDPSTWWQNIWSSSAQLWQMLMKLGRICFVQCGVGGARRCLLTVRQSDSGNDTVDQPREGGIVRRYLGYV